MTPRGDEILDRAMLTAWSFRVVLAKALPLALLFLVLTGGNPDLEAEMEGLQERNTIALTAPAGRWVEVAPGLGPKAARRRVGARRVALGSVCDGPGAGRRR